MYYLSFLQGIQLYIRGTTTFIYHSTSYITIVAFDRLSEDYKLTVFL